MPHVGEDKEFETRMDVDALRRVAEIRGKPDRLKRARAMIKLEKKGLDSAMTQAKT